jgi:hypothetical protein
VSTTPTLRQAAGNFADYGFCTSQNSNRKESIAGHAMPALKPNSTEPEIVGAFVALATFASNMRPLWRLDNNHFALIDAATLKEFAQKMHPLNQMPSMHSVVTNQEHPCGCHNDAATNSKDQPDVGCISIIEGEEQISCNAQQRKSIDDYKLRCSEFGGPLSAIELTMDEVVSELELPSTMPSESGPRRYLFYGKVWSPKAKFQVDFKVLQAVPLSKKAGEMTTAILSKWLGSPPIPRKRKRTAA